VEQIHGSLLKERENTGKFQRQLLSLLDSHNIEQLLDRIRKGSDYYKNFLKEEVGALLHHTEEMKHRKRMKTYLNSLSDLDQLFCKKMEEVDKALYLTEAIIEGKYQYDFSELTKHRALVRSKMLEEIRSKIVVEPEKKKKRGKKKKGELSSFEITLNLLDSGMTVDEIATERELVVGTIIGHLADGIIDGRVSIFKFMSKEDVDLIENAIRGMPDEFTSKDLHTALEGKFGYGYLRAVMNHVRNKTEPDPDAKGDKASETNL